VLPQSTLTSLLRCCGPWYAADRTTPCAVGIILGATYLSACLFSIPAILSPRGRPFLLKALNGWLIVISAFTLAVSGMRVVLPRFDWLLSTRCSSLATRYWHSPGLGVVRRLSALGSAVPESAPLGFGTIFLFLSKTAPPQTLPLGRMCSPEPDRC
jgi:hypothetical protein